MLQRAHSSVLLALLLHITSTIGFGKRWILGKRTLGCLLTLPFENEKSRD
jgi:hypothetical protein